MILLCVVGSALGQYQKEAVTHRVKFGVAVDDQFKGTITIAVYGLQQAAACYNFIELSKRPQGQGYNGTIFYRIFRNLLIEGGDFEANDGSGGKSAINNGTYPHNEYGLKHSKYSVSLASELKQFDSKFFIQTSDSSMFDGKYVVVGSVVDGRWLVDEIAVMEDSHGKPSRKVQIVRTAVEIAEADHNNQL